MQVHETLNAYRRDVRGSILPMFGLMFALIMLACGAALDAGRIYHSQSRLGAAADAAAIAAGKALLDGRNADEDIKRIAVEYFHANLKEWEGYTNVRSFGVTLNRATNTVEINLLADVPMTLTRIAGIESVDFPITSVATFQQKDIELAMALDITGSMSGIKISSLKSAAADMLDILLPDGGTPNKVRVAFAPYSSGVNAGSFASAATNFRSTNGCTFERQGSEPEGDQAPSVSNYLKVSSDLGGAACPTAKVVGLTDDKALLKANVNSYAATGTTAGHLGAQWASYLVSPHWGGVLGAESVPVAYNDGKTVKAVVIMTDGENNTFGGRSGRRTQSDDLETKICTEMKSKSIIVFTIGFTAGAAPLDAQAQKVLQGCASDAGHFFLASDSNGLHQAFTAIAAQLNNLRISK